LIVNESGDITRRIGKPTVPLDQPHEALMKPDGNILIANCRNDTIIEVDPEGKPIWVYDLRTINWTVVDPTFGENAYITNPHGNDWSHVNDVELQTRNGTEFMLLSIRNFDMIVEVNYTSAVQSNDTDESDITWYFGYPGNYSMLNHQHNADYLVNGNIIVADSENQRVVEINYATKEIVWESPASLDLYWVRDADENPSNPELLLITDSLHHRVIEFNKNSSEITWQYTGNMIQPYQADYLDSGNILIADGAGGNIIIVEPTTNSIIRQFRTEHGSYQYVKAIFLSLISLPVFLIVMTLAKIRVIRGNEIDKKTLAGLFVAGGALVLILGSVIHPSWLLKTIVQMINVIVR
ncbi:hypothetical protein GF325_12195, partial [Candidatus Bathyarchaeota archaeon]|nr:hypothetical protein [Candidatus Bathyarchaeota archaeon]